MITQILPKVYELQFESIQVVISEVDPKQISRLLQVIREDPVLNHPDLAHLKRVKNQKVLICQQQNQHYIKKLTQFVFECQIIEVSKHKPVSKQQFDQWSAKWPLYFHTYPYEVVNFDEHQVEKIQNIFKQLQDNFSQTQTQACVVANQDFEIIQWGYDKTNNQKNSINHCIMDILQTPIYLEKSKKSDSESLNQVNYYLNGLDVYLIDEPCPMCSMALVHSRVRRVFYQKQSSYGALNRNLGIHLIEKLNHHYLAFQFYQK